MEALYIGFLGLHLFLPSILNHGYQLANHKSWLQLSEEWFQRIIWTDEKIFVLSQAPHRENERIWAQWSKHRGSV